MIVIVSWLTVKLRKWRIWKARAVMSSAFWINTSVDLRTIELAAAVCDKSERTMLQGKCVCVCFSVCVRACVCA